MVYTYLGQLSVDLKMDSTISVRNSTKWSVLLGNSAGLSRNCEFNWNKNQQSLRKNVNLCDFNEKKRIQ